jgi:two-component system cell cycle response regulator
MDMRHDELVERVRTIILRKHIDDSNRDVIGRNLRLSAEDELTGLANRRAGIFGVERLLAQCGAEGKPLALLAIDLDGFKQINDTYGHAAGDAALQIVVARVSPILRKADLIFRMGGDELIVAMPSMQAATARLMAERIRSQTSGTEIALPQGGSTRVTLSIGLAMSRADGQDTASALIRSADEMLYLAKASGRNAVSIPSAA